ncbi:MAG: M23 family metallopeptidase [Chlorobiaceae bacterium]
MRIFLLTLMLMLSLPTASANAGGPLRISVDHARRAQGEFFTVTLATAAADPSVLFLNQHYRMFRQPDGSWQARVPVENLTPPARYPLLVLDADSAGNAQVTVLSSNLPIQHITLDPSKQELHATEREKSRVKAALHAESPENLASGRFLRPAEGETSGRFGLKRSYNGGPVESYHKGLDIAAPMGAPVRSMARGTVILTGRVEEGFMVHGNTVIIDHGQGLTSIYMHLSSITAKEGQSVEPGELIGKVGHTGISTAPHLHWGTYLYGTSVNPELFEVH